MKVFPDPLTANVERLRRGKGKLVIVNFSSLFTNLTFWFPRGMTWTMTSEGFV
jgi:hypothetical protein